MKSFKKTLTQIKAINILSCLAMFICLFGSSRSGKSFIIMFAIIVRACKVKSDHLIVRESFASCRATIWNKTLPDVLKICFPNLGYSLDKTQYICTLSNGSKILIGGLDDAKRLERHLGSEYSSIWANEANQIPYLGLTKLVTRLAQKNSLKKKVYLDLNPTKKTSWVYQLFFQKVNPADGEAVDDPENYQYLQMNVHGNIDNIDENYIKTIEKLPEQDKKRFYYGEFSDDNAGAAVYAFDREEHVSEEAVKQQGSIYVGSDFNYLYNSDVLCSRTNNHLYVWDEIQIEGDTYKKADMLKKKGASGAWITCDSTGKSRSTKGISDHEILRKAGFVLKYKTNPEVSDKIANLNRCFSLGIIKIHPRCKKLIRDLTQLQWTKDDKLDQKTDPSLSHLVDALAYLCWQYYPLIENKFTMKQGSY